MIYERHVIFNKLLDFYESLSDCVDEGSAMNVEYIEINHDVGVFLAKVRVCGVVVE